MKRFIVLVCALALVFVCKESVAQQKQKSKTISYPYSASYSSDFEIGGADYAKKVLELWKDYDDNTFDKHDYFADTAIMFFPDGMMVRGKDSILAGASRMRSSFQNVSTNVDAWVPLKSRDKDQNWVAIWGTDNSTGPDGKVVMTDIHEIWGFNKDGKIVYMQQYASKHPEMQGQQ